MKPHYVNFTDEQWKSLESIAHRESKPLSPFCSNVSVATIIRRAVDEYLERQKRKDKQ